MANQEVINNQQKTANLVDGNYTVVVSGAGTTCEEKPVLKALLPGIRLHFLRYAYFPKNDSNVSACRVKDETDDHFTIEDADASNGELNTTDNFTVIRTPLNRGYVYLFNADDPNDYHELEVDEVGNLSHVIWNSNNLKEDKVTPKDIRTREKDLAHYKLVVNTEKDVYKKYWVGYSPVQWSYDYHKKMHNASDDEKRKRQMILVECKGVKKGEEEAIDHILPYHKVEFGYYKDHGNQKIKDTLKQIHQTEKKEDQKGGNDTYEDMFITFHDPIGAANDIADELSIDIIKQKALLESIQTGRDLDVVLNRMLNAEKSPGLTKDEEQIGAMVNLALTQYKLIYDSQEMIDDYDGESGKGVDKNKLLNILGVAERKQLRERIRGLQNDLGELLSKAYFKDAYHAYEHGSKVNLLDGKRSAVRFYKILAIKPHLQDKIFDLIKDEEKDTQWDGLIVESLQDSESEFSVYNVLNKILDLDEETINEEKNNNLSEKVALFIQESLETYARYAMEDVETTSSMSLGDVYYSNTEEDKIKQGIDLTNKSAAVANSALTDFAKKAKTTVSVVEPAQMGKVTVKGKFKLTLGRLNKIHRYGEDMFEVRGYEVRQQLSPEGWVIDNDGVLNGKYRGGQDSIRWVESKSPAIVLKETSHGRHVFDIPVTKEVEKVIRPERIRQEVQQTKAGAKVSALLDGAPFRGVVALLQVFNVGSAMHTLGNDFKTNSLGGNVKNMINVVGISAELTSATAFFMEKALAGAVKKTAIRTFSRIGKGTNMIGAGVTVVMCSLDAWQSFDARDTDAGFAWVGAAAAFSVVAIEAVMVFRTGATFGIYGAIAGGIGAGLVFLAYYLQDTPIEKFFKNNALSDDEDFNRESGESIADYNKRFYKNRAGICTDSDYQKWNDFKFAAAHLTDLMVSSGVNITPTKLFNIKKWKEGWYSKPDFITTGYIKKMEIGISFRQFLKTKEQLAYKFYFFKDGLKGEGEEITDDISPVLGITKGTEQTPPKVSINVEIPKEYTNQYTDKSILMIISALSKGDGEFYPTSYTEETRLLGSYVSVLHKKTEEVRRWGRSTETSLAQSNVAIEPLNKLLSGEAWEN